MRLPDVELDGWCLEDGEAYHTASPHTFWIPPLEEREALETGDLVKLIFHIRVDSEEEPEAIERMWVIVRERIGGKYLGLLDNEPDSIDENDEFWAGIELAFEPRHVIQIEKADEDGPAYAMQTPMRAWPRD